MFTIVRPLVGAAAVVTLGFTWTVGQSGLAQTNRHLCELWRSLPLPNYQACEFQYALVVLWVVAAVAAAIWLAREIWLAVRKFRNNPMFWQSALAVCSMVGLIVAAVWIVETWPYKVAEGLPPTREPPSRSDEPPPPVVSPPHQPPRTTITTGPSTTPVALGPEDIRIKITIWESVERQMADLDTRLNRASELLDTWQSGFPKERGEMRTLNGLSGSIHDIRKRLEGLRTSYTNYADVDAALKAATITPGAPMIPGSIFDQLIRSLDAFTQQLGSLVDPLPQDAETTMAPYVTAVRRNLNAVKAWQSDTQKIAATEREKLRTAAR
jgi:hypothetical protein